jgi:glucose/arabinose dehydrogenase
MSLTDWWKRNRGQAIFTLMMLLLLVGCATASSEGGNSQEGVVLELVADGFTAPVALASPRDGTDRLFIADQRGTIWVLTAAGEKLEEPFLDVQDRMVGLSPAYDERGLLGLTFHPQFAENGRFFVYYSAPLRQNAPQDWNHTSHLSEFRVSKTNPDLVDVGSERIILQIDQPQGNHNGGQIAFGPDGYLYVPLGDGGGANDVGTGHPAIGNGQDKTTLLGSILRIDVDNGDPYGIPVDNPFVGQEGREEIFAYGLRNPFRITFDAGGEGQLFAGDVGQDLWEEVDIIIKGGNYGWHIREGTHCFDPDNPGEPPAQCPDVGATGEPLHSPIIEYDHDTGISVIGGYVYRGSRLPDLQGRYIFADWSTSFVNPSGSLFAATPAESEKELWNVEELNMVSPEGDAIGAFVLSLGQDTDGELYVLTTKLPGPTGNTGKVYALAPAR